jgi:hypothetical protein
MLYNFRFPRAKRLGRTRKLAAIALTLGLVGSLISVLSPGSAAPAQAVTASDFQPGNLISDVVMYNKSTMSVAQIQAFLNQKEPTCASGYTCLKSYKQDTANYQVPTTGSYVQGVCAPYVGASGESAATIIWKVAQYCNVNPQVILVTLQKEESLVTSSAPSTLRYRSAMGYGCPDTAVCNSDFYGFFKQVYWGARAMQRPVANYKPGVKSAILYSPNRACGTRSVTVLNKATSNLYTYTPYTPDAKALANLKGTGDSCSSYGNRNFWVYFNSWFGSTVIPQVNIQYAQAVIQDVLDRPATTADQYKWGRYLLTHAPRAIVPSQLLTTPEYRTLLVNSTETSIYGATTVPTGAAAAELSSITRGSLPQDDLVPDILGSPAFYATVGGTSATFVTAVYHYIDGRVPTDAELAAGVKSLLKTHRGGYAKALWHSTEAMTIRANALFETYLLRPPTAPELSSLLGFMKTHTQASDIAHVMGMTEYLLDAETRFPVTSS